MAAIYSSNEVLAQETGYNGTPVKSSADIYGRVRRSYISFVTPSGMLVDDQVRLARLPKGARVHSIRLVFEAMGAGAAADIGLSTAGEAARYAAGLSVAAAGHKELDPVIDKLPDAFPVADEPTYVIATVEGAAWVSDKKLQGVVEYVVE